MTRPASFPGRLLEPCGDARPRGMAVFDRTRLIGRLRTSFVISVFAKDIGRFSAMPGLQLRASLITGCLPWQRTWVLMSHQARHWPARQGSSRIDQTASRSEVTRLIVDWQEGGIDARERLIALVYDDLRRAAAGQLGSGLPNSLRPTELVHEAYLKLSETKAQPWQSRAHFMAVAAMAMRQIAIDHARHKNALKRDGGLRVTLREGMAETSEREIDVIDLHAALERLSEIDSLKSRIVEMHYFGGMGSDDIAEVIGCSAITIKRGWQVARAWLHEELKAR